MTSWLFLYTEDSEGMGYGWRVGDCNAVPHKIGKPREGEIMEMELEKRG